MSIEERVSKVLCDGIGTEPGKVLPEALLKKGLGLNPTEIAELIVLLEKEFGLKIPEGLIHDGSTVRDVVNYLSKGYYNDI